MNTSINHSSYDDILVSISDNHIKTTDFKDEDIVALCNSQTLNNIINNVDYEGDIINTICQYPIIFTTYKYFKENIFIIYNDNSINRNYEECNILTLQSYKYIKYLTNNFYCSVDKLKSILNIDTNIAFIQNTNEIIDTFFFNDNEYININNLYNIFDRSLNVKLCNNYNKLRYMIDREINDIENEIDKNMIKFKEYMFKKPITDIYDKNKTLLYDKLITKFNITSKYKCNLQMIVSEFKDFNSKILNECILLEMKCFKNNITILPFIELFDEIRICVKKNQNKNVHYISVKTKDIEELYNKSDFNFKYSCLSDEQKEEVHKYVLDIFPVNNDTLAKISHLLHQDDVIIFAKDFFASINPSNRYSYLWIRQQLEELTFNSNKTFLSRLVFW